MDTKLVYVLISNERDLYLEMSLLSVVSARIHNPNACIVLVTDQTTIDTCRQGLRREFLSCFDEVTCVDTDGYDGGVKKSRYIKTTLRQHVRGDYLFIDTDTVVCDDLSSIDNIQGCVAMARDMHFSRDMLMRLWGETFISLGHDLDASQFYNSGVLYAKDIPVVHSLYCLWHEKWLEAQSKGINVDQPPLMKSLKESGLAVSELSGVWNCQLSRAFIPYLAEAKILHFHTGSPSRYYHKLADDGLLRCIKAQGGIDEATYQLLLYPKSAFIGDYVPVDASDTQHVNTDLYRQMKLYKDNAPFLYKILERFSDITRLIYDIMKRSPRSK